MVVGLYLKASCQLMCLEAPCQPLGWQNQPKPICWPKLTNLNETQTNVMNTISMPIPVCLLERNISIPAYFGYRFGIYRFIKKKYIYIYIYMCVGQFCPVFQLCEGKGPAQYPVWGETNIRGHPAEKWIKLPSEERWSMFVRNWAVSEDYGHLGTFVRGAWWTC